MFPAPHPVETMDFSTLAGLVAPSVSGAEEAVSRASEAQFLECADEIFERLHEFAFVSPFLTQTLLTMEVTPQSPWQRSETCSLCALFPHLLAYARVMGHILHRHDEALYRILEQHTFCVLLRTEGAFHHSNFIIWANVLHAFFAEVVEDELNFNLFRDNFRNCARCAQQKVRALQQHRVRRAFDTLYFCAFSKSFAPGAPGRQRDLDAFLGDDAMPFVAR